MVRSAVFMCCGVSNGLSLVFCEYKDTKWYACTYRRIVIELEPETYKHVNVNVIIKDYAVQSSN